MVDKNKLLEELKKLKQNLSASPIVVIEDIESLVESLDVKEVDDGNLEKYFFDWYHKEKNRDYNAGILYERYSTISKKLAKHFFKLGLQAHNEEIKPSVKIDKETLCQLCDAILNHYGYSDINDCPDNGSECFYGKWDKEFREKVKDIRNKI